MSCANRQRLTAVWLLGCVLSAPALQAASLPSFDAGFRIMNGSLRLGTNEVSLTVNESGDYRYESHTWPSRWISWLLKQDLREVSRGVLDHAGIRPLHYEYRRTGRIVNLQKYSLYLLIKRLVM